MLEGSPSSVLTEGFGPWGSPSLMLTTGLGVGEEIITIHAGLEYTVEGRMHYAVEGRMHYSIPSEDRQ
jgi:hypothetical protein